jgi:hypothetical protein
MYVAVDVYPCTRVDVWGWSVVLFISAVRWVMNFVGEYASSDEEETNPSSSTPNIFSTPSDFPQYTPSLLTPSSTTSLILAPTTLSYQKNSSNSTALIKHNQKQLLTNPKIDVMLAPSHGPIHPYRFNQIQTGHGIQQVGMGHVEDAAMDDYAFDDQYKTYLKNGYAFDLNDNSILGSFSSFVASQGESTKTTKGL